MRLQSLLIVLAFILSFQAYAKNCEGAQENKKKDGALSTLILELDKILARGEEVTAKYWEKNKFLVKSSTPNKEVCLIPINRDGDTDRVLAMPRCMTPGEGVATIDFDLPISKKMPSHIYFPYPINAFMDSSKALKIAEQYDANYGGYSENVNGFWIFGDAPETKSLLDMVETTIHNHQPIKLDTNALNGVIVLSEDARFYPAPFNGYLEPVDAYLFAKDYEKTYGDKTFSEAFNKVHDEKSIYSKVK